MGFIKKLIKFSAMRTFEAAFVFALVVIMPKLPPYGEYSSFKITPPVPLEGTLAPNTLLEKAERLFENQIAGPESFADYGNELYISLLTGQVVKLNKQNQLEEIVSFHTKDCLGYYTESKCGRPLGLEFDKAGNLFVMETYSGIWKVDVKTGKKELLISVKDKIDGKTVSLPNSISIASNGDIYWSDSSAEYTLDNILYPLLADGTGRLFKYSAATQTNEVLIDKLSFGNGVQLSENEDFVIVSDLTKGRILRYHLSGPKKGTQDVFLDGIPGAPDNIHSNKRGGFLVGLVVTFDNKHPNLLQVFSEFPYIRKFVARIFGITDFFLNMVNEFYPHKYLMIAKHYIGNYKPIPIMTPKRTTVLDIDNDGKIIASYHAMNVSKLSSICDGYIFDKYMYLGSPYNLYLARVKLSDLGIDPSTFRHDPPRIQIRQKPQPQQQKPTTPTPKQTTTTPKPTTAAPKPTTTAPKPTTTTPKPTTTTPKPTTTAPKPQTKPTPKQTPPNPTQAPPKPTQAPPKPTQAPPKPEKVVPKPVETKPNAQKPTGSQQSKEGKKVKNEL